APVVVVSIALGSRWNLMGIMTRDTSEPAATRLETTAAVHLLDLADGLEQFAFRIARVLPLTPARLPRVGRDGRRRHENGPKLIERQSRPVVEDIAPHPFHPHHALKAALLAHAFAQGRFEVPRIDNRAIERRRAFGRADMEFARSVAALAADGVAGKGRLFVAVHGLGDRFGTVAVAEKALGRYRVVNVRR